MSRISAAQYAFSSGEVSPLIHARPDFQRFKTGLAACRGFLPLVEGPFTRAPGTIWRGNTRNNLPARLVPFEFAADDALTLEFTDGIMRVWRYGALVESSPGVPYELVTPYDATAIGNLHWVQSADVIYIADGVLPIQKLSRLALDNWTIAALNLTTGPFRVQNLDKTVTVTCSAGTGSITLTTSADLFVAGHVGSLMMVEPDGYDNIAYWTSNTTVAVGDYMRNDGKIYQVTAGSNTGAVAPVHTEGTELTDMGTGIKWAYVSDGRGVVTIDAVTDARTATATVNREIPPPCVGTATYRWSEGAWSTLYGYPSCLEIVDQRLVCAASTDSPRTIWFSTVGDFEGFLPGTLDDDAFAYAIAGQSSINRIIWLQRGSKGLYIGALGEEQSSRSSNAQKVISATNLYFGFDSAIGSKPNVQPISPNGTPIFISKDGKRIFEISYSLQRDKNDATELTRAARHIGAAGIEELTWQSAPNRIGILRLTSGELALMLNEPDEEVLGFAPYPVAGGFVEGLSVTPDAATGNDVLTMVVQRQINGQTVRFIEEQAQTYGTITGTDTIFDAVHFFAAATFTANPVTDTFSVPHLAGESVYAWTDTGEFGPLTVAGDGSLTVGAKVGQAVIGLFDDTHYAETLDLQGAAPDGAVFGRELEMRGHVGVGVHRTAAGKVQSVSRQVGRDDIFGDLKDLIDRPVASDLTRSWSGLARVPVSVVPGTKLALRFIPVGGAPMTITGVAPPIEEEGLD